LFNQPRFKSPKREHLGITGTGFYRLDALLSCLTNSIKTAKEIESTDDKHDGQIFHVPLILFLFQCFYTVGWVTGRTPGL